MKIIINKQKARVLALICFIGFQPMPVKAAVNVSEWTSFVTAYLTENKPLAAALALFSGFFAIFVGRKMYIKQNANKLESLLRFHEIRSTTLGSTGSYGLELSVRNEKLGRILYFVEDKTSDFVKQNQLPEALRLLAISGVKEELIGRQENHLAKELDRSGVWKTNIYAHCAQALIGQPQSTFKESVIIGDEDCVSEKEKIRNQLTFAQRQRAGLEAFVKDFNFHKNSKGTAWLKNTVQFKDSLEKILN